MKQLNPRGQDKIQRAVPAAIQMEQGRIWFPEPNRFPWQEDLEAELFTWTGHPAEPDDQVDVLAYAAIWVAHNAPESYDALWELEPEAREGYIDDLTPEVL